MNMFTFNSRKRKENVVKNIDKYTKTRRKNRINIMMENTTENLTENQTEEAKENVTVSSVERNSEYVMKNELIQIRKAKVNEEICLPNVDC